MTTNGNSESLVFTVEEARRLLRLSRGLMYDALRRNEIPNIRIGRRILIPRSALIRLLDETEHTGSDTTEKQSGKCTRHCSETR